jgi:septal ring factor EnvC (AmiA/AmiB activator)
MRRAWLGLALALSLASLSAQGSPILPTGPSSPIYESELARSIAISARLAQISTEQKQKLKDSAAISNTLLSELATLKLELAELRAKLESSETRSARQLEELTKAESLLASLETSFSGYRLAAEAKVRRLNGQRLAWGAGGVVLGTALGILAAVVMGAWR